MILLLAFKQILLLYNYKCNGTDINIFPTVNPITLWNRKMTFRHCADIWRYKSNSFTTFLGKWLMFNELFKVIHCTIKLSSYFTVLWISAHCTKNIKLIWPCLNEVIDVFSVNKLCRQILHLFELMIQYWTWHCLHMI